MKRGFLLGMICLAVLSLFNSCKKDNDDDFYFKIVQDGVVKEFEQPMGEFGPASSGSVLIARGQNPTGTELFDLIIYYPGSTLTPGTYTFDNSNSDDVAIDYSLTANLASPLFYELDAGLTPEIRYVVNITSVEDKVVTGNFTGNYLSEIGSGAKLNVTSGEFKVKLIY